MGIYFFDARNAISVYFLKRGAYYGLLLVIFCSLSGCLMGPNFHPPCPPNIHSYNAKPLPKKTVGIKSAGKAGKSQVYQWGRDLPGEWWTLFHSKEINELVAAGLNHSPTVDAAIATLRQAEENVNVQIGTLLFPNISASLAGQRQKFSSIGIGGGSSASIFNVFNASVNVSYNLDVFGASRRTIESYKAQVDNTRYKVIAAYLTLTTNIVTTAINIASLDAQIRTTKNLIRAEQGQLNIVRKQWNLGGVPYTNVMTQQTLVDQTRANLPTLEKSLSQARHQLDVLIGAFPNSQLPIIRLEKLNLPKNLPVSFPSCIVKQRPDVQQSAALLHVASANVGVATANLFPQFNFTGSYGWQALTPALLFHPISNVWNYAGQVTQPIFRAGALLSNKRAAEAAFDAAYYQYQQVVLQAFQNVADSLRAVETDARAFRDQKRAESSAARALSITRQQYNDGGVSYTQLLNAQQQYQQVVIARIQAQALRYSDTAALFSAFGGGWWNFNESIQYGQPSQ